MWRHFDTMTSTPVHPEPPICENAPAEYLFRYCLPKYHIYRNPYEFPTNSKRGNYISATSSGFYIEVFSHVIHLPYHLNFAQIGKYRRIILPASYVKCRDPRKRTSRIPPYIEGCAIYQHTKSASEETPLKNRTFTRGLIGRFRTPMYIAAIL